MEMDYSYPAHSQFVPEIRVPAAGIHPPKAQNHHRPPSKDQVRQGIACQFGMIWTSAAVVR
jgi:hypothetical protein